MADSEHLSRDVTEDAVPFPAPDLVRELPATSVSPETVGPAESDDDIEKNKHTFPKHLRIDTFDAMILYQENNKTDVQKFLEQIKAGKLSSNGGTPSILLYDEIVPELGMSPVEMVDLALPRCTYVFLYITKEFYEDNLFHFSSNTCIMNSILKPDKMWSVVPIFTDTKSPTTYDIPASVLSLRGIQFKSQSTFDVAPVVRLFDKHSLNKRLQKEKELKKKRLDWIRKEKEKNEGKMRDTLKQVDTLKIQQDEKHPRESQLRTSEEAHTTDAQHFVQLPGNTKSAGKTSRSVQTSVPATCEDDHTLELATGGVITIGSVGSVYIAENINIRMKGMQITESSEGPNTNRKMLHEEHTSGETPSGLLSSFD
ncbi:uncharacterized protein [Littorina saxatilis]|uniref:Uncharacterized protein n=1 Tax=Littorina saxatilis TaxID=31220 RepID=A0AAN9C2X5_9CAEN